MYEQLKYEACQANLLLPKFRLIDLTFGNLSIFDPELGVFAIKPSGVSYDVLQPDDMVVLDLDGKVVDGNLRPSSDTPTHRCLYRAFPGIRAVVHTHSRYATAFAQAGREIPCLGTTHADFFHGPVPVTRAMREEEIREDYEWNTGTVIVERLQGIDPLHCPGVLVRSHGPFTWGTSGVHAAETALIVERLAEMALHTLALKPDIDPIDSALHDKHFLRKHGKDAYYGQQ